MNEASVSVTLAKIDDVNSVPSAGEVANNPGLDDTHLISSSKRTKLEKNGSSNKTQASTKKKIKFEDFSEKASTKKKKKLENVSEQASTTKKKKFEVKFEDVSVQASTKKKKKLENASEQASITKKKKSEAISEQSSTTKKIKSDNVNVSILNKNLKNGITLTRQMVEMMIMKAIKQLKKGNGASSKDIIKYVKENYDVDMGSLEMYINKCLGKGIKDGIFEKISEGAAQEKYKLKISKINNEASQKSLSKKGDSAESVKPTKNNKSKLKNEKSMAKKGEDQMLKSDSVEENEKPKVKAVHSQTSEMVMNSIKSLKKRKGAKFEDIQKYIEENYQANMKLRKSHIIKFLKKSVDNGVIEKISEADYEERYKIKKKTEKIIKDSEDRKHGKGTSVAKKSSRNKKN